MELRWRNNLSMTAVFSVVAVLAGTVFGLALLLTWLNVKYNELTGRPVVARQTSPWLRSMRDERGDDTQRKYGIGGIERVVVICAVRPRLRGLVLLLRRLLVAERLAAPTGCS